MASKRIKNRCYWAAVKHIAATGDRSVLGLYADALEGIPDRLIVDRLTDLEATYGTSGLRDVRNSDLWPFRQYADKVRNDHIA